MTERIDASATAPFDPDEVAEVIRLAARLDEQAAGREGLTLDQLADVASELGISRSAVVQAARAYRRRLIRARKGSARAARRRLRLIRHVAAFAIVVAIAALIDALGGGGWWFFYPAGIWAAVLGLHALRFVTRRDGPVDRYLMSRAVSSQSTDPH